MSRLNHVVAVYFIFISILSLFFLLISPYLSHATISLFEPFIFFIPVFYFESPILAGLMIFSASVLFIKNKQADFCTTRKIEKILTTLFTVLFFVSLALWGLILFAGSGVFILFMFDGAFLLIPIMALLIVLVSIFAALSIFHLPNNLKANRRARFWAIFFSVIVVGLLLFYLWLGFTFFDLGAIFDPEIQF